MAWFGAGAVEDTVATLPSASKLALTLPAAPTPRLKLMTYNLFWEALQAEESMAHCSPCKECDNKCVQNIARIVASFSPDVLALQEIRKDSGKQWGTLHAALRRAVPQFDDKYGYTYTTKLPIAGVMTLYDKRKLHVKYTVEGNFLTKQNCDRVNPGRPFLITVFAEPLIVINLHFPHLVQLKAPYNTRASLVHHLRVVLQREVAESRDPAYQIVVAGDFNLDDVPAIQVHTELSVMQALAPGKLFHLPPTILRTVDRNAAGCYDHILTTIAPYRSYFTIPTSVKQQLTNYMSDHLPVMATV